jgi:hypothetical protein
MKTRSSAIARGIAVLASAAPFAFAGCSSVQPGSDASEDKLCGVLAPAPLFDVLGRPGTSIEEIPPRTERLGDAWAGSCEVELDGAATMTIAVQEAEEAEDAAALRASVEAEPRCDRVVALEFPGWICENAYGADVLAAMPDRVITLTFRKGAGTGLSESDAESLIRDVNDGIEALDKRHAG